MFSSSSLCAPPPLVVDWGSYSVRIGTAGDALPRCLLPAVVGLPHPQLCCSSSNGSSSSNSSRTKWRGGLSSNCRLFGCGGHTSAAAARAAAGGAIGYPGAPIPFICPLNPLQKRDHVDVYPVAVYEHPSFGLLGAAAGAAHLKQQHGDSFFEWLTGATDNTDEEDGDEEDNHSNSKSTRVKSRREHAAFSAAAGSSCTLPGAYHVNMNGFESLMETACSADALDEGSLEGRAVLLSEPNAMDKPLRDAYAELMFETFKTSQFFLGKKAALACFGCARTSSLVVDVGHSHMSACGVQEGYVLQKSIREIPFAAQQLSVLSRLSLERTCASLTPGYAVTRTPLAVSDDGLEAETAGGSAAAGDTDMWGVHNSNAAGTSEAAMMMLHASGKKQNVSSHKGGSSSLYLSAATGGGSTSYRSVGAGAISSSGGRGVKTEGVRGGNEKASRENGGGNFFSSTDKRYTESIEVTACPHVTQSYRDWARFHLAEVLAQVLGECHPTAAAARKQRQEFLLYQQQQWTTNAGAAAGTGNVGGVVLQQQQQQRRRRGVSSSSGGQSIRSTTAAAIGKGKVQEEENASMTEQQLLQQTESKQQQTTTSALSGGRRGGTRRRSSGTSGCGGTTATAAAAERKRGRSSDTTAGGRTSSGSRGKNTDGGGGGGVDHPEGGGGGGGEDEEPPYVLPDGTPVAVDTVRIIREGIAEALFSVSLRLQVFSDVWAGRIGYNCSSRTHLSNAAVAAYPAAFIDAWRCCNAAATGNEAGRNTGGGSNSYNSAGVDALAAAAGNKNAPLWNAYEAAVTGATCPRFISRIALSHLIRETLSSCGRGAARRDVTATVIPTGGGSLYPGFLPRFKAELRALAEDATIGSLLSQHSSAGASGGGWGSSSSEAAAALLSVSQPLRVVASPVDVERHFASWIGGSILSCLGSFSQFAVTKEEYDEYGPRVAIGRKCP